jgi:hypothetical protein
VKNSLNNKNKNKDLVLPRPGPIHDLLRSAGDALKGTFDKVTGASDKP